MGGFPPTWVLLASHPVISPPRNNAPDNITWLRFDVTLMDVIQFIPIIAERLMVEGLKMVLESLLREEVETPPNLTHHRLSRLNHIFAQ